jgi:hypothetical protein
VLLLWQTVKYACRILDSMVPHPRASPDEAASWAVESATSLPEVWALVAKHRGVLGAWQMMRVCKAARQGATEYLRSLLGLVVCGGVASDETVRDVRRLDLATLRWEPMPALVTARSDHACCVVRGTLVVLGGMTPGEDHPITSEVEMLSSGAFVDLPPLSRGGITGAAAIEVDESDSAAGQVLLLGGGDALTRRRRRVHLVDLATGACARQPDLLHSRVYQATARLPDGRIICAGGLSGADFVSSAEVWGAPEQGGADAAWAWRELPAMSAARSGCRGCLMSDGRFAVLGGEGDEDVPLSSCEALAFGVGVAQWAPLPPIHDARDGFACGAVAGCVIDAGGQGLKSAEVYVEELNRWLRLAARFALHRRLSQFHGQRGSVGGIRERCPSCAVAAAVIFGWLADSL